MRGRLNDLDLLVSLCDEVTAAAHHIIALLRYLKDQYISDLEVSDEGGYWDAENRPALERKMSFINIKIEHLCSAISSIPGNDLKDLSADEIATRIEQIF